MKTIKKNVYYCDHCKKKGLAKFYIVKHEKGCTLNPNRICGLCESSEISELVNKLKSMFTVAKIESDIFYWEKIKWIEKEVTLKDLREWVDNCPNCLLALVRQSGLLSIDYENFHFNYKIESASAFANKCNDETINYAFQP